MARVSLSLLPMLAVTVQLQGCLLGDPPEYKSREQTTPILLGALAEPPLGEVVQADVDDTVEFRVPFRSEDAGEQIFVALYRDSVTEANRLPGTSPFLAAGSNLFDEPRLATVPYTFKDPDRGCHSYTLLLAHESDTLALLLGEGEGVGTRVAMLSWMANVGDDGTNLVRDCGGSL